MEILFGPLLLHVALKPEFRDSFNAFSAIFTIFSDFCVDTASRATTHIDQTITRGFQNNGPNAMTQCQKILENFETIIENAYKNNEKFQENFLMLNI